MIIVFTLWRGMGEAFLWLVLVVEVIIRGPLRHFYQNLHVLICLISWFLFGSFDWGIGSLPLRTASLFGRFGLLSQLGILEVLGLGSL